MTDVEWFLLAGAGFCALYAFFTLRSGAARLHYRDRPLYWRGAALPLLLLVLTAGVAVYGLLNEGATSLFVLAASVGALIAALAWFIEQEPSRLVRWAYRTERSS